jgi:hypothetical protein
MSSIVQEEGKTSILTSPVKSSPEYISPAKGISAPETDRLEERTCPVPLDKRSAHVKVSQTSLEVKENPLLNKEPTALQSLANLAL